MKLLAVLLLSLFSFAAFATASSTLDFLTGDPSADGERQKGQFSYWHGSGHAWEANGESGDYLIFLKLRKVKINGMRGYHLRYGIYPVGEAPMHHAMVLTDAGNGFVSIYMPNHEKSDVNAITEDSTEEDVQAEVGKYKKAGWGYGLGSTLNLHLATHYGYGIHHITVASRDGKMWMSSHGAKGHGDAEMGYKDLMKQVFEIPRMR